MQPFSNPVNPLAGERAYPYALDMPAVMRTVYLWLAIGLAVSFGVAYWLGQQFLAAVAAAQLGEPVSPVIATLYSTPAMIVALIAYLVLGFGFYPIVRRTSPTVGAVLFLVFAAVFGLLMSTIFAIYDPMSIAAAFAITAGMFAIMSVIGYVTRADLSKLGGILIMGLIGIIIASLVNLFLLHNNAISLFIAYATVVVFCGLTAWDTQWIRKQATALVKVNDESALARVALVGAFKLFLDFINLFLAILRILGRARN